MPSSERIRMVPLSRRERKKQTTRDAIFKIAQGLFNEKGFENTSVEEITQRIDVAQSTFFNYFPRKEDLLTEILSREIPLLNRKCRGFLTSQAAIKTKIHQMFAARLMIVKENENIVRAMIVNSLAATYERPYKVSLFKEFQKNLIYLLANSQSSAFIRKDVSARKMANILEGVFTVFVIDCIIKKQYKLSSKELYGRLTICLEGLYT